VRTKQRRVPLVGGCSLPGVPSPEQAASQPARLQTTEDYRLQTSTYEDQQKMAESLNRRKSIFLSHYECMRVAPLVRITLGSMKRSSYGCS
jgi:hypothetical protein